jgi:hypothetical protein
MTDEKCNQAIEGAGDYPQCFPLAHTANEERPAVEVETVIAFISKRPLVHPTFSEGF